MKEFATALDRPIVLGAAAYRRKAEYLFNLLFGGAAPRLRSAESWIVSADGPVLGLPIAALVLPGGGGDSFSTLDYVVRRHRVSYVPSASVLVELTRRPLPKRATGPALVAFGDPERGDRSTMAGLHFIPGLVGFEPGALPGSREEVRRAAERVRPAKTFVGPAASEYRVKTELEVASARYLHFAAHGLPDESRPELSAILLAAGDASEDGLLQAWEISALSLECDLVVLSACRSALGREIPGEGFLGLTQAFLEAGARSVLATVRSVDDQATARLMDDLYAGLAGEQRPAEALAMAQRAALARGGLDAHPAGWAAFVLIGDSPSGERHPLVEP